MSSTESKSQQSEPYLVIKETWLTQKPSNSSLFAATISTFFLAAGSFFYLQNFLSAQSWMPASKQTIFESGEYWRLFTTIFAHADFGHFASNSFLFFVVGFFLNGYFGFLIFPMAAIAWGGITNYLILTTYSPQTQLIGASGVVYWMGGTWLSLYFLLSRQKNLTNRLIRSIGVALLIFMPAETFQTDISYRTHFAGFTLGIAYGVWHFFRNRKIFQSREVSEWITDEDDPENEIPGPEGIT